jgi:hypothetical protein
MGPSVSSFGLHTFISKDASAPEVVDIVAVHGLNGNYTDTWTDEKVGVNWLRDCLAPKTYPGHRSVPLFARVMTFSYNSGIQFSKLVSDISDFAD